MNAAKRWLFAVLGAAVIVVLVGGLFFFTYRSTLDLLEARCLDKGGQWDDRSQSCYQLN